MDLGRSQGDGERGPVQRYFVIRIVVMDGGEGGGNGGIKNDQRCPSRHEEALRNLGDTTAKPFISGAFE